MIFLSNRVIESLQWNTTDHLIIIIMLCIEMYPMNEFLGNIFLRKIR